MGWRDKSVAEAIEAVREDPSKLEELRKELSQDAVDAIEMRAAGRGQKPDTDD